MNGNSGRVTAPPVQAAKSLCRVIWVDAWSDGEMTVEESARMDLCEHVVYLTAVADATVEAQNALMHRNGIESPHAERRMRELRNELRVLRGGLDDPTPAGPSAARSVKQQKAA